MQAEKSLCASSVRELEARLLDVQDRLMQKVREVAAAREVQASLRTEIESYKALIDCQEKKYAGILSLLSCHHATTVVGCYHRSGRLTRLGIQCESKNPPPLKFSDIFPNFQSKFYSPIIRSYLRWTTNFIQLRATLTKLCHIKRYHHNVLIMSTIDRNARWVVALNMA